MEQDGKSRALPLVASTDPQFTTDPFDKRPNNRHPQSFANGWIKPFRKRRTIVGNRQRVALSGIRFQPDHDPAFAIFGCVRDQLGYDEAERNAGGGLQVDLDALDSDDLLQTLLRGQYRGEVATMILDVLLQRDGLLAVAGLIAPVKVLIGRL